MKVNNKGFTLIELLAVIAILTVLVILAVPTVLSKFKEAKINTFKIEAQNIVKAAEKGYFLSALKGDVESTTYTYNNGEVEKIGSVEIELSGRKPQEGQLKIMSDGKIAIALYDGKYCASKSYDTNEMIVEEKILEDCISSIFFEGVKQVAAGENHSIFLMSESKVKAVGRNNYGQLGDGTTTQRATLVEVINLNGIVNQIAAGESHSLFLMSDGIVKATGFNGSGQLGDGTNVSKSTPVEVVNLNGTVKQVAAGGYHTLFLMSDGTVKAVGNNATGQLGDGTTTQRTAPVEVTNLNGTVKQVAAGIYHSVFLMEDGTVKAVGYNAEGGLGDGTTTQRTAPVEVVNLNGTVKQVAAGYYFTVFLMEDGTVKATGRNSSGQLGDGTKTQRITPVEVINLNGTVKQLATGYGHTIFLMEDGTVKAVGYNTEGGLGDGTTTRRLTPVEVINLNGAVKQVAAGVYHSMFLMLNDKVKSVGRNNYNQLGDETTINSSTPVEVNH